MIAAIAMLGLVLPGNALAADNTPPEPFSVISPSTAEKPDGFSNEFIEFKWQPSSDAESGIKNYQIFVDDALFATFNPASPFGDFRKCTASLCTYGTGMGFGPGPPGVGSHSWYVKATDNANNERTSNTLSYYVDDVPPAPFDLSSPADGSTGVAKRPALSWQASSDQGTGPPLYEIWIDGSRYFSTSDTSFILGEDYTGTHTWQIKAFDANRNVRSSEVRTFTVDSVAPGNFSLIGPAQNAVDQLRRPTFTWNASVDAGVGIGRHDLLIDGAAVGTGTCSAGVCSAKPGTDLSGTHTWQVKAYDSNGNWTGSSSRTFSVDDTAPVAFNLLEPIATSEYGNTAFSWEQPVDFGTGVKKVELIRDESPVWTCTDTPCSTSQGATSLEPGSYTWQVRATDANGNARNSQVRQLKVAPDTSVQFDADGVSTGNRTTFRSATFSIDSLPEGMSFECLIDNGSWSSCQANPTFTGLQDGLHILLVRATHPTGGADPTPAEWTWTVDTQSPPTAQIVATPAIPKTGQSLTLDASASADHDDGSILSYEFDPEGDGTFTAPTASPITAHIYSARGTFNAAVRITNANGKKATKSIPLEVRLASPSGPLGVSVNNGAIYTNNPQVTINTVWPELAANLSISNDGGFQNARTSPVDAAISWTLDSSGPERLPKTIYVRFTGGASGLETYQDDIILDETPPVVSSATTGGATASSFSAAISGANISKVTKLRLKASDKTSGVAFAQTAVNKKKPSKRVRYKATLSIKGAAPKFVRVQDRAGNLSAWKPVKKPGKKKRG